MAGKTVTRAQLAEVGLSGGRPVAQRVGRSGRRDPGRDLANRCCRRVRSRSPPSAPSPCARRASGSAATRRPARKCRSCRAGCWCFAPRRCSRSASTRARAGPDEQRPLLPEPGRAAPDEPAPRPQKSSAAFRTISEVADELDVAQHVLRFWESKFAQVRPLKRGGGRRYYRPEDVDLLRQIRSLLYDEGYTIKGAQKLLRARRSPARARRRAGAAPARRPPSARPPGGPRRRADGGGCPRCGPSCSRSGSSWRGLDANSADPASGRSSRPAASRGRSQTTRA